MRGNTSFWLQPWRLAGIMVVACLLATIGMVLLPPKFEARALLLLDSTDPSGLLSLARGVDPLSALLGGGGVASTSGYTYRELIESRSILAAVALAPVPGGHGETYLDLLATNSKDGRERFEDAILRLRKAISTGYDQKSGLLTVSVRHQNPGIAADIANLVVRSLREFNSKVRTTRASYAARFVSERLAESRSELSLAESRLVEFRQSNVRIGNSPRLQLDERRIERSIRLAEEIHTLLARELELARIQEKKESPVFTVVDSATPPVRRNGLSGLAVVGIGGLTAGALALLSGTFAGIAAALSRTLGREEA